MFRVASVAVGVVLCVSAPFASLRDQIFRGANDTVAVYATVRDRDGRLLLGLTQSDFEVFDNGKPRPITVFSNGIQPITIGLVLDRSGSMSERFDKVAAAAGAFVDELSGPDRASLSLLNWDCAPLTTDRSLLKRLLGDVMPMDLGSAIWDGLDRVLGALEPEPGRRAALLFSDGLNSGVTNFNRDMWPTVHRNGCRRMPPVSDASLKDLTRRADREGFLIYTISAASFGAAAGDRDLRALARDSGGDRFRLESDNELKGAFTRIADELHHQYLLGFVPAEFDGKTHEIDVRVKGDGLEVRARRRYVAVRDGTPAADTDVAPIAALNDSEAQEAVTQGLQGKRLQAVCRTPTLFAPGLAPLTYAEVTLEGPNGRIMRAAREAKLARRVFTVADVTADLRAPVVGVRVAMREGLTFGDGPNDLNLQRRVAQSVVLRSSAPPQLLQPLPAPTPAASRARTSPPEVRFDLAAFRAL
ncbi:MAG TPA: VWA domain-containing protein, partial [Vicinamibacterales bacterium]|nr:VWA domain-containing protein [Vicinamibacterales bacterium]